jgi:hypothetical protein
MTAFAAVGGWRTVVEALASKTVFLVAHLVTGEVVISALVAVAGVAGFAVLRMCTDRKYWQPAAGLVVVGVSAWLAARTGQAVDFYLTNVVTTAFAATVLLASILVRWPLTGLVVEGVRGEWSGWRRDRARRRRYQACTAVLMGKFGIATAVMVPLYLAGHGTALGITSTVMGTPATAACLYLCCRILGAEAAPGWVAQHPVCGRAGESGHLGDAARNETP